MATPEEAARRLRQLARRMRDNGNVALRVVAMAVDQTAVLSTPVDTGRARSNWRVGVGSPPTGTIAAFSPGSGGSSGAQNAQAALDAAKAVLSSDKLGDVVYVSNNVDYIMHLNDGSSPQAPAGFIQLAIQAGIAAAKKIKLTR